MYKEVMRDIEGIGVYPAIGLVLFFTVFVLMLVWVWKLSREYVSEMERLPLEAEETTNERAKGASPHGGA